MTVVCPGCENIISSLSDHDTNCLFWADPGPFPLRRSNKSYQEQREDLCLHCGTRLCHPDENFCSVECRTEFYVLIREEAEYNQLVGDPEDTVSLPEPWWRTDK